MKVEKQGFPVVTDNEMLYMAFVNSAIEHSDPDAIVAIRKNGTTFNVIITPSDKEFRQHIINNLLGAHKLLNLKIIFSKSLSKMRTVVYDLYINE